MINDEKRTACFTGHREIPNHEINRIKQELRCIVIELVKRDVIYYGNGGARGFDLLAAQIVIELKTEFPQLRLIMVLPCKEQTRGWSEEDKTQYAEVLHCADKIVYTAERYFNGCMQKRNRHWCATANTAFVI